MSKDNHKGVLTITINEDNSYTATGKVNEDVISPDEHNTAVRVWLEKASQKAVFEPLSEDEVADLYKHKAHKKHTKKDDKKDK